MNLLADESVDAPIVARLRSGGYDVVYVAELAPGIPDDEVLRLSNETDRLLLTADKDFGDLVFRQGRLSSGVILIRLAGLTPEVKAALVLQVVNDRREELAYAFTVITSRLVRIRRPG